MLSTDKTPIGHSVGAAIVTPRCAEAADQELVDIAISHIHSILEKTVQPAMEQIGHYLLEVFYRNDTRLYFSSSPTKHVSLRLLVDRCKAMGSPFSRTFLGSALRMAAVSKALSDPTKFHKLPTSHRLQLLRLRDPQIIESIASQAVSENLSVLKLRDLVDRQLEQGRNASGRGRRPTSPVLRVIGSCLHRLQDEQTGKLLVSRSDIRNMTALERTRVEAWIGALQRCLDELRRFIR